VYEGSIDAKMAKMIVKKQEVIDRVVNKIQDIPEAVVVEEVVKPIAKDINDLTKSQIECIHLALKMLAGTCDGAMRIDNCGFNKMDAEFGKSLAVQRSLSQKQAKAAKKMLKKYWRQLPKEVMKGM
jgi:hypothetical protein